MSSPPDPGRVARVVGVAALGVALTGFALGLAQVAPAARPVPVAVAPAPPPDGVAPTWSDLAPGRRGPNAGLRTRVPEAAPPGRDAAPAADPAARAEALARRAERRAFDGAPPVIPHPVDARSVASCLACHQHGLRVGDVSAPALPHAPYASCTQCHAPAHPLEAPSGAPGNAFVGLRPEAARERAWPGAPPVIPHGTWLREDCLSCHGPSGPSGLQATHPWRQSCTQCHAPRASSP